MPQVFRDGEWQDVEYVGTDKWPLPAPAPLFWRLPIIRHVRYAWSAVQVARWNGVWASLGRIPTGYDERILQAIWRGEV